MRTMTGIILTGIVSAVVTIGSAPALKAQYYPPPGYGYAPPPPYASGPYNPCPPSYTVQSGICQPYRGPRGRWGAGPNNPCPTGYTVQDGVCKPYRGY